MLHFTKLLGLFVAIHLNAHTIRFIAQPRSGTTLSTDCIAHLTGLTPRKFHFPKHWDALDAGPYQLERAKFFFSHNAQHMLCRSQSDKLIGQIRNYKERLLCMAYTKLGDTLSDLDAVRIFVLDPVHYETYLTYLKTLDMCPQAQAFLLYYEMLYSKQKKLLRN